MKFQKGFLSYGQCPIKRRWWVSWVYYKAGHSADPFNEYNRAFSIMLLGVFINVEWWKKSINARP